MELLLPTDKLYFPSVLTDLHSNMELLLLISFLKNHNHILYLHSNMELLLLIEYTMAGGKMARFTFQYGATVTKIIY